MMLVVQSPCPCSCFHVGSPPNESSFSLVGDRKARFPCQRKISLATCSLKALAHGACGRLAQASESRAIISNGRAKGCLTEVVQANFKQVDAPYGLCLAFQALTPTLGLDVHLDRLVPFQSRVMGRVRMGHVLFAECAAAKVMCKDSVPVASNWGIFCEINQLEPRLF